MMKKRNSMLTDIEHVFMQVLWSRGELSPEEVRSGLVEIGHRVTGGTVRKMLLIMTRKGYVSRRKVGKKFLYKPAVEKNEAHVEIVTDILSRVFNGRAPLMMASLLDSSEINEDEIAEIEHLISEYKKA